MLNRVLFVLLLISGLGNFLYGISYQISANENQFYMILEQNVNGLALECVLELPYEDTEQMEWDRNDGFTQLNDNYNLVMQVVEVDFCNVNNVYYDNDSEQSFRWGFENREWISDNVWAVHPTRGVFWINMSDER